VEYVTGVGTMAAATDSICPKQASYVEMLHVVAGYVLAHSSLWFKQSSFELTNTALEHAYPCHAST
jgi:hypothetical protein